MKITVAVSALLCAVAAFWIAALVTSGDSLALVGVAVVVTLLVASLLVVLLLRIGWVAVGVARLWRKDRRRLTL